MHHRFAPKVHHFEHRLFMFCLDLDELEAIIRKVFLFSHNRRNIYSLCDADHEPAGPGPLKARIVGFLGAHGIDPGPAGRVLLLTLPRVFGYIFNPISVFYCFDGAGAPIGAVVEVGNTFREMKLYLLRPEDFSRDRGFAKCVPKHFYVSPFSSLELSFDFRVKIPGEILDIQIDDCDGNKKVLVSTLSGRRAELNNRNLTWFTLKYPLVTLKVIFLIHWQALRLWLKRIPFYRKAANPALQQGVLRPHSTLVAPANES
jgi:DUF1365 family protein